jgi:hypothetical protein
MMRRSLLFLCFVVFTRVLSAHTDPRFLSVLSATRPLTMHSVLALYGNPAGTTSPLRYGWGVEIRNHFETNHFYTIAASGGMKLGRACVHLHLKHSPLPEYQYTRSLGTAGLSLPVSADITAGISLRGCRIALPEHYGSAGGIGSTAGVMAKINPDFTMGLAIGVLKTFSPDLPDDLWISTMMTDIRYQFGRNTFVQFTGEMIRGIPPCLILSLVAEVIPGYHLHIGLGTGSNQLSAGLSIRFGTAEGGWISSFNPLAGRSHQLFIHGNTPAP